MSERLHLPQLEAAYLADLFRQIKEATQRAERAEATCEQLRDDAINKLMAMSDEQLNALIAYEGRHPDDLAKIGKKTVQLIIMADKLRKAESALSTVRAETIERAAKLCEQMQDAKDAKVPDGAWRTGGTTEICGRTFAAAIRALPEGE